MKTFPVTTIILIFVLRAGNELNIPLRLFLSLGGMSCPVWFIPAWVRREWLLRDSTTVLVLIRVGGLFLLAWSAVVRSVITWAYIPSSASCCRCATQAIVGPLEFLSCSCSLVVWKHFRKGSWGCFMRDAALSIVHVYTFIKECENDSFWSLPYIDWKR